MKKFLSISIGLALILLTGIAPAQAVTCSAQETEMVRGLLVPITRLSAHQGRNTAENYKVIASTQTLAKTTQSPRLRNSLRDLTVLIRKGVLNPGSTIYWGYKDRSVWKTYKKALVITQENTC